MVKSKHIRQLLVVCVVSLWVGFSGLHHAQAQSAGKPQQPVGRKYNTAVKVDYRQEMLQNLRRANEEILFENDFVGPLSTERTETRAGKASTVEVVPVGTASNAYSVLRVQQNQVFAYDKLNLVGWIHRQNIDLHGGSPTTTSNGAYRIDYSLNAGANRSWQIDIGPMNPIPYPNAARGRYPQAIVEMPEGKTAASDLRCIWAGPTTDGSGWGNYTYGVASGFTNMVPGNSDQKQNGVYFNFLSNQQDNGVLIPSGLCKGRNGEYWMADNWYIATGAESGNVLDSIAIWKGTIGATGNSVSWKAQPSLRPNLFRNPNDGGILMGTPHMAFSPDGKWGWVCLQAHMEKTGSRKPVFEKGPNGKDSTLVSGEFEPNPIFYYTSDYGTTWNGPIEVFLRDYSVITDSLLGCALSEDGMDTICSTQIPFMDGSFDITVDKNGNPHVLMQLVNSFKTNPDADSLYYIAPGFSKVLIDLTTPDNGKTWCPMFITRNNTRSGRAKGLTFGNYNQIATNEAGTHIFYSWVDDTTATGIDAMQPDLWQAAFRITDSTMTEVTSPTMGDASWGRKMIMPTVSPTVLTRTATQDYLVPTIFVDIIKDELNPVQFYYLNRAISESDFKKPANDVELKSINNINVSQCGSATVPVGITLRNAGTAAISDSIVVYYTLNGLNPVVEKVTLNTPLAPGAEITHQFRTQANIAKNGTYELDVYAVIHDDNTCSNSTKKVTITNFGGADGKIFQNATETGCGALTLSTGLGNLPTVWKRKRDNQIISRDPEITITEIGTEDYEVEVTSAACNNRTIRGEVKGTVYAPPVTTLQPSYEQCKTVDSIVVRATNNPSYTVTWKRERGPRDFVDKGTGAELVIDSTGVYIATVKDPATQCEIEVRTDVALFDITLKSKLGLLSTYCVNKFPGLIANNESTPQGKVTYDWKVSGCFRVDTAAGKPGKEYCVTDSVLRTGSLVGSVPTIPDSLGRPATYTVTAKDRLNCSTKTESVSLSIRDTVFSDWEIIWPKPGCLSESEPPTGNPKLLYDAPLTIVSKVKRTTPLTGLQWSTRGAGTIFVKGTAGSPSTLGTDTIVISYPNNRLGDKEISLIGYSGEIINNAFQGCSDTISFKITVVRTINVDTANCVSRNNLLENAYINVFPNPSTGIYNLTAEGLQPGQNAVVSVFDVNGRLLLSDTFVTETSSRHSINLETMPAGIYLMKLETPEGFISRRLIKR